MTNENSRTGLDVFRGDVKPEWIDVNGHMNVAYYVLAFDFGTDALWDRFGITNEYINVQQGSTFAVECHVTYQREILEGDPYVVSTQILAYDEKRIHQFQRMYHGSEGHLIATCEWLNLFVDLKRRRVANWPGEILGNIGEIAAQQVDRDVPPEVGQKMRIVKPLFSLLGGEVAA